MGLLTRAASHRALAGRIFSAVPDFALAGFFVVAWLTPAYLGPNVFTRLVQIMLMEFVIIHSSAFLGVAMTARISSPRPRLMRVLSIVGLGLLYTLFVGSFALWFRNPWLVVSFWMLLLNRSLSVILGPAPKEGDMDFVMIGWATAFLCYLGLIFLTSLANLPRFGVTEAAIAAAQPVPTGGIWADAPWRVAAFGALYYASMGIADLLGLGMPSERSERSVKRRRRLASPPGMSDGR